ncbi:hypothetical protein RHMOL_Rhmol01G0174400 [Rhododendron molle]|uniref:Uncharacterized protein n=1 Tax=Rhododendron molle TaxID=49168 RepID=A0ACC0Q5I1_RHOML|nr:hypothetical protein RHMOL_Rhmol01G0174400 [Rhododendron molle]
MDSRTPAAQTTVADLLYYKALLAPVSPIPMPHLGICDPDTSDQLYEIVVMPPLTHEDQHMDVETQTLDELVEEIRRKGERWLEIREKEWMEQLREFFGLVPPRQ